MSNRKRIGVVLSGCGVQDGSEIHEAVLTLLAIDRADADAVCMAPDIQLSVVNHLSGRSTGERRSVLPEAARIARGKIRDVAKVEAAELDALVFPGGLGAAQNLSDFATKSSRCTVNPAVEKLTRAVHAARKPIGAMCIAPVLLGRLFGAEHPSLTIGADVETSRALEAMGAVHERKTAREVVVDAERRLVSTPAYMLGTSIADVAFGIEALVREVVAMT
jgi:enhancing lycopene biosynthesis protein 2